MRRIIAASVVVLLAVLVLGVGQAVLPGIAASSLRSRLSRSGRVLSVSVSAFPAIELLWHDASSVTVRMASYHATGSGGLASLLNQAQGVGTLRASVGTLDAGLLTLTDATLVKRGNQLVGQAALSEAALRNSIPFLRSVTFVRAGSGTLTLDGTVSVPLLGGTISAPATVEPRRGALVAVLDVPLLSTLSVRVFSDPNVQVRSVGGAATPAGLRLNASGVYR